MANTKTKWIVLLACSLAMPSALAEGFYVAFDYGESNAKAACNGIPTWMTGCTTKSSAYRLSGGYVFSSTWSTELGYVDYGSASAGKAPYAAPMDWKASGLQLSVGAALPVGNVVTILGKLGAAYTTLELSGGASANSASYTPAYGLGAQLKFNEIFSMRAMYEDLGIIGNNNTGTTRLTLLSLGLVCHF